MLYYFQCRGCGLRSPLFLKEEVEAMRPVCIDCDKKGESHIELRVMFAFFYGCNKCNGTWKWFSSSDYSEVKPSRPHCPVCTTSDFVYFIPATMKDSPKRVEKRKRPGYLDPQKYDVNLYETVDVTETLHPPRKKRRLAPPPKEERRLEPIPEEGEKTEGSQEDMREVFELEIEESTIELEPVKDESVLKLSLMEGTYKREQWQLRK